ncbi:hypothetical protein SMIR_05185 [Streptomyces mirabilis]|uniref:hypothetical protein n=1 Tax=Streptomyces mirabilis TaxID=68239 RepID=UPI001BAF1764|nr:hypothetical protein [Streptomyces mirabilis]QUW78589.1 hypothetical protein SMIR_05185 [Streptomyces mirabilis]
MSDRQGATSDGDRVDYARRWRPGGGPGNLREAGRGRGAVSDAASYPLVAAVRGTCCSSW